MKFCVKHSIHFYQRKLGIFVLLLMPLFTFSQNNWAVKSSVGYGFLSPHHKSMQYLIESHSFNANLGLNIKMRNTNNWLQEWRMPTVNLSYYFASPGNKNAIGYAHSLLISSDISIITFGKSKLYYSIGGGIGYITKPFDKVNNYYQTFISSHLNAHLRLGLGYAYAFNKLGNNINFQISLDHFSNAKFYAPNLGINMLTVNLGYTHVLTETLDSNIEDLNKVDEQKDDLKWYYNFNIAGGVKQNFDYDTKHFLIASLYSDAFYKVNEKRALGLGAEFTYDNSIASYYLNSTGEEIDKTFRFGLHLAQDLYFGNIIVYCQVGAYLINPKPADSWIYNRLMLKYPVYKNLLLGIGMKTHTSVADCLQFSVTYRLD